MTCKLIIPGQSLQSSVLCNHWRTYSNQDKNSHNSQLSRPTLDELPRKVGVCVILSTAHFKYLDAFRIRYLHSSCNLSFSGYLEQQNVLIYLLTTNWSCVRVRVTTSEQVQLLDKRQERVLQISRTGTSHK